MPTTSTFSHGETKEEWEAAHRKLKQPQIWRSLALDGYMAHAGKIFETRRCPCLGCGSTISKRTSLRSALEVLASVSGLHTRSLEVLSSVKKSRQSPRQQQSETQL
jgi:hypothetical protein